MRPVHIDSDDRTGRKGIKKDSKERLNDPDKSRGGRRGMKRRRVGGGHRGGRRGVKGGGPWILTSPSEMHQWLDVLRSRFGSQRTVELLGLDVGEKRVGVALSHGGGMVANPLCTLRRRTVRPPSRHRRSRRKGDSGTWHGGDERWRREIPGDDPVHREELFDLVRSNGIGGLVVGWPLHKDGSESSQCRAVMSYLYSLFPSQSTSGGPEGRRGRGGGVFFQKDGGKCADNVDNRKGTTKIEGNQAYPSSPPPLPPGFVPSLPHPLPIVLIDERYTSQGTMESLEKAGLVSDENDWRAARRTGLKDSVAAAQILEALMS